MKPGDAMPRVAELVDLARLWAEADPEPAHRLEALAVIDRADPEELGARFGRRLEFGTAGLRAEIGAGPMRLNRVVARQTASGISAVLRRHDADAWEKGVVVAHDARVGSNAFAADIVEVLRNDGVGVHLLDGPSPTPLAAFGLRHVGAAAAVVVTASHNPAEYNGIKVFWADGAQIAPPLDAEIASAIDEVAAAMESDPPVDPTGPSKADAARPTGAVAHLGAASADSELVAAYLEAATALVPGPPQRCLPMATTAMHGVGGELLAATLEAFGHDSVQHVAAQQAPDPRFPTVAFPNPEEPGAMESVMDLGRRTGAAVALALDPDADRLAVAAPKADGEWHMLTGDETGALLTWRRLALTEDVEERVVVTTIVSSRLVASMAREAGARFEETLTGFKWLSRPAIDHPRWHQVIAYEEALGYAVGPDTRDKDGITAALVMADAICALAETDRTVWDVLDALARTHGAHVTQNGSERLEGDGALERLGSIAASLAADPPEELGAMSVLRVERPADDVMRLVLEDDTRVVLRPSGTEPKFKYYCEAIESVDTQEDPMEARRRASMRLRSVVADLADVLS